jgi:hypothetical protein
VLIARLSAQRGAPVLEPQAIVLAEQLISLAPVLGLNGPEDICEVLDLWLSIVERGPISLYAQGLMRVVLSIPSWSLAARISFLRRHLEGREVTPDDNAMVSALFGMGKEAAI